jgi:hypothetical protein
MSRIKATSTDQRMAPPPAGWYRCEVSGYNAGVYHQGKFYRFALEEGIVGSNNFCMLQVVNNKNIYVYLGGSITMELGNIGTSRLKEMYEKANAAVEEQRAVMKQLKDNAAFFASALNQMNKKG